MLSEFQLPKKVNFSKSYILVTISDCELSFDTLYLKMKVDCVEEKDADGKNAKMVYKSDFGN